MVESGLADQLVRGELRMVGRRVVVAVFDLAQRVSYS
jgi:hypothetical protein